ncbi:hypothetical protein TNCV_3903391 [Trichonephila clavipes]|nr:hypothetical protein TNCV_3903391 [Trichonephila clavipes]
MGIFLVSAEEECVQSRLNSVGGDDVGPDESAERRVLDAGGETSSHCCIRNRSVLLDTVCMFTNMTNIASSCYSRLESGDSVEYEVLIEALRITILVRHPVL